MSWGSASYDTKTLREDRHASEENFVAGLRIVRQWKMAVDTAVLQRENVPRHILS